MADQTLSRREALAALGLSAFGACSSPQPEPSADRPPNVVLIMSDDLGYECLGCYGGTSYKTPNLDALAASGVRFTHAYSQPLCTPTRIQLMTGQYNFRNWMAFGILDPAAKTFGHMMQDAGYKTCISGKWQLYSYNPVDFEPEFRGLGMPPEDAGFDDWFLWHARHTDDKGSRYPDPVILDNGAEVDGEGKYGPDLYVDRINSFIEANRDEPFFVYYPMALTHGPFNPTPNSEVWADGDRFESNFKYFGDMVDYMDLSVGRIVSKLDEMGLRENTLILFFSDNGTPKGVISMMGDAEVAGGKGLPSDAGTRVPLIANWAGKTPEGAVLDDLIDSTDFIPTIADVTGAAALEPNDGRSFAAQLRGETGNPKDVILCWHDPRPGVNKENYTRLELWARDRRFKLYDDGRLYDVPADVLEESPIPVGGGGPESEAARGKLRAALDNIPVDKREPGWDPYAPFARSAAAAGLEETS